MTDETTAGAAAETAADKPAKKAAAKKAPAAKATASAAADKAPATKATATKAPAAKAATKAASATATASKTAAETAGPGTAALKVHHLRPAPGAKTAKTRVGRGEASKGKTAGRGTKGTKARYQVPAAFEGGQMPLHMRLPKLKGFTNRFRVEYQVVNTARLALLFPQGGTVGVDELVAAGAVRDNALVKVLGDGDLSVKLNITAHKFSASAREKIAAAGGSTTEL